MGTFHAGEIDVQIRAGVRAMSERVANGIHETLVPAARGFLEAQPFVVVGSVEVDGRIWARLIPGPLSAIDERTVRIPETLHGEIGMVIMDLSTRRRMRLNGTAANGLLHIRQSYSNCPKYIQKRTVMPTESVSTAAEKRTGTVLTNTQQRLITAADTFFIATNHSESGADASHRGGNPGFVTVIDERTIIWADFTGNAMFNTLGNLAADARSALLFADFTTGDLLCLSGRGEILWDGTDRSVLFTVEKVEEIPDGLPFRMRLIEYSPFNPVV